MPRFMAHRAARLLQFHTQQRVRTEKSYCIVTQRSCPTKWRRQPLSTECRNCHRAHSISHF